MKVEQLKLDLGTRVERFTGLKSTSLETLVHVTGMSGVLLAVYCTDPDDLTQNERIRIIIDDVAVLDDITYDIPNTDDFIHLLASIAKGFVLSGTGTPTDSGSLLDYKGGIPFQRNLDVEYLRAVAGTTGLTINIVYAIRADMVHQF